MREVILLCLALPFAAGCATSRDFWRDAELHGRVVCQIDKSSQEMAARLTCETRDPKREEEK